MLHRNQPFSNYSSIILTGLWASIGVTRSYPTGQKSGDISGSIISTLRNLTRILIRILILLLGGLLVLLTFIELLTNHGSGTGVQGMATAANITRSERKRY